MSATVGVAQPAIRPFSSISSPRAPERALRPPVTSATVGVGHGDPVDTVSLVRRVDGASRDIDRPEGVARVFQIRGCSVEPMAANRSINLLSHDDRGPAGGDEGKEVGPQVPWITSPEALSRDAFALARTGAGPNRSDPAGEFARDFPEPGAGEEVSALVAGEIVGPEVFDASLKDGSFVALPQHGAGDRVDLVEDDAHTVSLSRISRSRFWSRSLIE